MIHYILGSLYPKKWRVDGFDNVCNRVYTRLRVCVLSVLSGYVTRVVRTCMAQIQDYREMPELVDNSDDDDSEDDGDSDEGTETDEDEDDQPSEDEFDFDMGEGYVPKKKTKGYQSPGMNGGLPNFEEGLYDKSY